MCLNKTPPTVISTMILMLAQELSNVSQNKFIRHFVHLDHANVIPVARWPVFKGNIPELGMLYRLECY